jgi:flagellar biosynthesis/type III secretory pathway M-ring protein FliF/YscJ
MLAVSLVEVVKEVISSWQVLVITVVLILFLQVVFHVAKPYHRPRASKQKKPKKSKETPAAAPAAAEAEHEEAAPASNSNEELGLEEA